VVGRRASVEGLDGQRWTAEALNRWLANPRAMAPQTRSRFPGFADAETRDRVVRFLKGLE
jgi:cytochrome c